MHIDLPVPGLTSHQGLKSGELRLINWVFLISFLNPQLPSTDCIQLYKSTKFIGVPNFIQHKIISNCGKFGASWSIPLNAVVVFFVNPIFFHSNHPSTYCVVELDKVDFRFSVFALPLFFNLKLNRFLKNMGRLVVLLVTMSVWITGHF